MVRVNHSKKNLNLNKTTEIIYSRTYKLMNVPNLQSNQPGKPPFLATWNSHLIRYTQQQGFSQLQLFPLWKYTTWSKRSFHPRILLQQHSKRYSNDFNLKTNTLIKKKDWWSGDETTIPLSPPEQSAFCPPGDSRKETARVAAVSSTPVACCCCAATRLHNMQIGIVIESNDQWKVSEMRITIQNPVWKCVGYCN